MRLTTKGEYAVRCVVHLLHNSNGKPLQIRDIARAENISKPYIEQLFNKLRKSGLLKSVRGPAGGYMLAKKPSQITIGDIIKSVEGPVFLTLCASGASCCQKAATCRSYSLWRKMNKKIEAALDSIKLGDI